jgi:hypothetical protein
MADSFLKLPGKFEKGKSYILTGETLLAWQAALLADRVIPGPGLKESGTAKGRIFTLADTAAPEPYVGDFCGIITQSGNKYLRGGIIICGEKTWNMDDQPLNLGVSGIWLVSISVSVTVNRDDGNKLLLPGVKTGTRPGTTWTQTAWSSGTDYPNGNAPSASSGTGTVILPIGQLTIENSVATFANTGCGGFTIEHCAGSLSYYRS